MSAPPDAEARRSAPPVVVYPEEALPRPDVAAYREAAAGASVLSTFRVPPREGRAFEVAAGGSFVIRSVEGPQVGDLNLWNAADLTERFFSGKTRALHGTHVGIGDRLWSCLPYLRPMATVIRDDLDWYGIDADGAGVHDVIGTRCDPYTHRLLSGEDYHRCCHSNLSRGLAAHLGREAAEIEHHVHDVLNVFMATGFTRDEGRYFMKASPVRPGDEIAFFAEIDLVCVLSACPGGDCGATHSSDAAACFPLEVEVRDANPPPGWSPPAPVAYDRSHGARPPESSNR